MILFSIRVNVVSMFARKPPLFLIVPALIGLLAVAGVLGYGLTHMWEKSKMASGSYYSAPPEAPTYGKPIAYVGGEPIKTMPGN